ncbi:phage portal protein [uncultured Paraglaciecola sp.]|uniref:phage portal protein n=1 Tax=uncultured Paraglaciecola sp. TaxID=1765024 RepID=UPI00261AEDC9|nr:phage portal protein [uncultured Paraglaciecola sp.]
MNLIDEVVGVFDPVAKLNRLRARKALDIIHKRSYDGARSGRRTNGWVAGSTSANSELAPSLTSLRNRSRDLVRNNPYASKVIRVLTSNVVGTGIMPNIEDKKTAELWEMWALEVDQCDADGCFDFLGLQSLIARTIFESGECIVRLRHRRPSDNLVVPLQLQVLEPDYLDSNKFEKLKNGGYIQYGIEYNALGKRVAYWLFKEHPGENSPLAKGIKSFRVVADDVIHIYEKNRPGQSRGVPILSSCMMTANDLDEYEEATLVRKAAEACITAVVNTDDSGSSIAPSSTDAEGRRIEELSPGMVEYLGTNESITFNNPPASVGYSEYVSNRLHSIAAGAGVTYEQMTGDLSKVNYSSIRAGMLDFRREVEQFQWLVFVPMLCRKVIRAWGKKAELTGGRIKLPARVEWTTPRFDWVDPLKDVKSETEELISSRKTFSQSARERGFNPNSLLEELAKDREMFKKKGIPYPYDTPVDPDKKDNTFI